MRDAGYATFFAGKWHLGTGNFTPNAQGFGPGLVGTGQFYYPPSDAPPPDPTDDPKTTDRIANEAVRFIDANKEKPFFAYLPFLAVHTPIQARADLVAKYQRKRAAAPPEEWGQERERQVRLVQNYGNQGGAPCGAVRDGDWKLIEWYEDGSLELYNLRDDLSEKKNLAVAHADKMKELHGRLRAWRASVGAKMAVSNP